MFHNYFKTALRNLLRDKVTSMLNLAGLTLGITCSLVLFLLISHLSGYDTHHKNRDRIYRIVTHSNGNNGTFYTAGVPPALPDAFRQDFPEAEEVTFASYRANALIQVLQKNGEAKKFQEESGVVFAQPSFFRIFDRPFIKGSVERSLDEPNEAVISKSLARKYFGREEVLGEIIRYDTLEYRITGLIGDHPDNTDFPFDLLLSYETIKKDREATGWRGIWSDEQCYILLGDKHTAAEVDARMPAFVEKYLGSDNYRQQSFALQPLRDLHFDDRFSTFSYKSAPREMLIALGVIAVFLIITACINFVNLSTAEAIKRSKEVGVRKSLGSTRRQLIVQFLGETTIMASLAMLLSLGVAQLALTVLNPFMDLSLALDFSELRLWIFAAGVTMLVTFFSGLYPSLVLSAYKPALALKNQISNRSSSGFFLRRGLVVAQFFISQFLIMGTIVLVAQMDFLKTRELGFTKDAVMIVPVPEAEGSQREEAMSRIRTLRDEITRLAGVELVSLGSTPPSSGAVRTTGFYLEGEDESNSRDTQVKYIDGNYLRLYDIGLVAGGNVDDYDTARGLLVNEEFVRISGLTAPQDIVGRRVIIGNRTLPVTGVVRDFHTVSLHDPIEAAVMMNNAFAYRSMSVRANQAQLKYIVGEVKTLWEQTYPDHIFSYEFLDEYIHNFYDGEQKMSVVLTVFTSIAIFIGCLGLFGLATFMANQKTKEVGVRKALGASAGSIVLLFSKEYIKLIFAGFLLAAPLVWLLMSQWLDNFAYKISIGPFVFVTGFCVTLLVAVLTVGYKSFSAAVVNPIRSLRYE